MRNEVLFIALIFAFNFCLAAEKNSTISNNTVDWKFYGGLEQAYCFFDLGSIERSPIIDPVTVKVWIKCLPKNTVDKIYNAKTPDKESIERSAQKIANYYIPPIALIEKNIDPVTITSLEDIATFETIKPIATIYYELNCHERKFHELTMSFDKNGKSSSVNNAREWQYIPPEGNISTLSKITCMPGKIITE